MTGVENRKDELVMKIQANADALSNIQTYLTLMDNVVVDRLADVQGKVRLQRHAIQMLMDACASDVVPAAANAFEVAPAPSSASEVAPTPAELDGHELRVF